ncbi:MAG: hypothetical protein HY235_02755 [Acidobacteria bacterium]|nr:hypothetical protein [Acidobacteriota bacterium]
MKPVWLLLSVAAFAEEPSGIRFGMKERPRLEAGNWLAMDFRAKFQMDFRQFRDLEGEQDLFDLHRARVGIEGKFFTHFEFELERELSPTNEPWKDAYINYRRFRRFQIQGGKFKMPFGMDQLTGPAKLDFIYRSRIGSLLAPGRDVGFMVHGRLRKRALTYEAGVFRQDGENARSSDSRGAGDLGVAARLTTRPARYLPLPKLLHDLEAGAAITTSEIGEGQNGLRGRDIAKNTFFRRMDVAGRRRRFGTELRWTPGPFAVKGEFIGVREQRLGQSILGEDLSPLLSRGWYLTGLWRPLRKKSSETPLLELAGRYEQIRFGSAEHPGVASRSLRAGNILGNSDRVWTTGLNWKVHRYLRVQVNGIHEKLEDRQRAPVSNRLGYWSAVCRLQVVM